MWWRISPCEAECFAKKISSLFAGRIRLWSFRCRFFAGSGCLAALDAGMADAALVVGKPEREDLHASWMRTMALCLLVSTRHELAAKECVAFSCMVGSWPCRMISVATKRWWSGGLRKRACVRAMLRLR